MSPCRGDIVITADFGPFTVFIYTLSGIKMCIFWA